MQKVFIFCVSLFLFSNINSDSLYKSLGYHHREIKDNGRIFDSLGSYRGRVESNGSIYNSLGNYLGKIEKN